MSMLEAVLVRSTTKTAADKIPMCLELCLYAQQMHLLACIYTGAFLHTGGRFSLHGHTSEMGKEMVFQGHTSLGFLQEMGHRVRSAADKREGQRRPPTNGGWPITNSSRQGAVADAQPGGGSGHWTVLRWRLALSRIGGRPQFTSNLPALGRALRCRCYFGSDQR